MKKGWKIKKIGDLCVLMTGGTPSRSKPEYFQHGKIKWLVSGDIHQKEIFDCEGRITEEGMNNSNARYLPVNSVLMALNGQGKTRGTVALLRTKATCNQSLVSICPNDVSELMPEFLYHNLNGRYEEIRKITGDDNKDRRGLNMPLIRNIEIPIPPLPEQQRIVSVLDEAFASIALAKSNAERNLVNARELFESVLNEIFSNRHNDWKEKAIEEVCAEIFAGGDAPNENYSENRTEKYKIPIFANAVKKNGLYGYTDVARVTAPSITISARGSGTGHTEIRNVSYLPIVRLIVLIPDLSLVTLEFLKHSIDNLEILRSGSAIPQLTVPMIKEYKIPFPPLAEQRAIVGRLEALSAETGRLEQIYRHKIESLEELKKSVLARAFQGEMSV